MPPLQETVLPNKKLQFIKGSHGYKLYNLEENVMRVNDEINSVTLYYYVE